nr:MAG TPA: hypothetical protein [Caudoviricetes sp.]
MVVRPICYKLRPKLPKTYFVKYGIVLFLLSLTLQYLLICCFSNIVFYSISCNLTCNFGISSYNIES